MRIVVTGDHGFIGFHTCKALIEDGHIVVGIDTGRFDRVYLRLEGESVARDRELVRVARRNLLESYPTDTGYGRYFHIDADLASMDNSYHLKFVEAFEGADAVIHLAALPGVRASTIEPVLVIKNNIFSTLNVISYCQKYRIKRLIYTSSSSVYGESPLNAREYTTPLNPQSPYAASKVSTEAIVNSTVCSQGLVEEPLLAICLRPFTVYGPYGRPDMAVWKWTKAMIERKSIKLNTYELVSSEGFANKHYPERSFTYVDDVIYAIKTMLNKEYYKGENLHQICNIGGSSLVSIDTVLDLIYQNVTNSGLNDPGIKALVKEIPLESYEPRIISGSGFLQTQLDILPKTNLRTGIKNFVNFYNEFRGLNDTETYNTTGS